MSEGTTEKHLQFSFNPPLHQMKTPRYPVTAMMGFRVPQEFSTNREPCLQHFKSSPKWPNAAQIPQTYLSTGVLLESFWQGFVWNFTPVECQGCLRNPEFQMWYVVLSTLGEGSMHNTKIKRSPFRRDSGFLENVLFFMSVSTEQCVHVSSRVLRWTRNISEKEALYCRVGNGTELSVLLKDRLKKGFHKWSLAFYKGSLGELLKFLLIEGTL